MVHNFCFCDTMYEETKLFPPTIFSLSLDRKMTNIYRLRHAVVAAVQPTGQLLQPGNQPPATITSRINPQNTPQARHDHLHACPAPPNSKLYTTIKHHPPPPTSEVTSSRTTVQTKLHIGSCLSLSDTLFVQCRGLRLP